jgi:hypothetical protein
MCSFGSVRGARALMRFQCQKGVSVVAGILIRIGLYFVVIWSANTLVSYPARLAVLVGSLIVVELTVLRWSDRQTGITQWRHRFWSRGRA